MQARWAVTTDHPAAGTLRAAERLKRDMGFLKRFFRNVFRDGAPLAHNSSFERLTEEELEAHLGVERYGDFVLTDAVRPSLRPAGRAQPGLPPRHLPRRGIARSRCRC